MIIGERIFQTTSLLTTLRGAGRVETHAGWLSFAVSLPAQEKVTGSF